MSELSCFAKAWADTFAFCTARDRLPASQLLVLAVGASSLRALGNGREGQASPALLFGDPGLRCLYRGCLTCI